MAKYDQTGAAVDTPVFPFSLRFEPLPDLQWSDDYTEDTLEQLTKIPSGTTVWKVYGMDAPQELGGTEHLIGNLVTASETVKSLYSDDMLLIRHQRAEDDIKLKPEWTDYYPKYSGPLSNGEDCLLGEPQDGSSCPFAFLLW